MEDEVKEKDAGETQDQPDQPDVPDQPGKSSSSLAVLGASNDGPDGSGMDKGPDGSGASNDGPTAAKRKRTIDTDSLPKGRSNEMLVDATADRKVTSKVLKQFIIKKSKDLARGLMGLMKGQQNTLGAFAAAGRTMLTQLNLYEQLKEAKEKWEKSQDMKDFDTLEAIEDEYEKAHEYTTAEEHGEETDQVFKGFGLRRYYLRRMEKVLLLQGRRCGKLLRIVFSF